MSEIEFPIEVSDIEFDTWDKPIRDCLWGGKMGSFVSIRPCGEEHEGKTFLGVLLGEVPVSQGVNYSKKTKKMEVYQIGNPAIYVPDLQKVIFGNESWWGTIDSPEKLREITKEDINNVWYVQALKALSEASDSGRSDGGPESG